MSFLSANIFLLHLTKTKLEMPIFTAVILINNYNHPFPSYILGIHNPDYQGKHKKLVSKNKASSSKAGFC